MSEQRDRHAKLFTRIWDDADWKTRSPRAQWLYMLLMSQSNRNWAGVVDLTSKRWAGLASGVEMEAMIASAMRELEQFEYIVVDVETEELLVRTFMRNDKIAKQPNVFKAALRQALETHSVRIRHALAAELRLIGHPSGLPVAEQLSKGSPNPSPNPSPRGSRKGSTDEAARNGHPQEKPSSTGFTDGFGEGLREPIGQTRGVGEGVGSSPSVGTYSSSSSSSEIASRTRPDVEQLCQHLAEKIRANGARASITEKWRTDARLLLDRDNREIAQALRLVDWATDHHFWRTNVLSMPTFRKQYDKLLLQAQAESGPARSANGTGSKRVDKALGFLSKDDPLRQQLGLPTTDLRVIEGGMTA